MKRNAASGLFEYLDALGLIDSRDEKAIARAKAAYAREYKRQWVAKKRATCKKFLVYVSETEHRRISEAARAHKSSVTAFMKKACLAYISQVFLIPDRAALASIESGLTQIITGIQELLDSDRAGYVETRHLLKAILKVESMCDQLLRQPVNLDECIRRALMENVGFREKLLDQLNRLWDDH